MHTTIVTMKDGSQVRGVIWKWRPLLGFVDLAGVADNDELVRVRFDDIASAVTLRDRIGIGKLGDIDEMARRVLVMVKVDDDSPTFEKFRRPKKPGRVEYTTKQAWSMCGRKKGYSKYMAKAVISAALERGDELRAYTCPICRMLHVTKKVLYSWPSRGEKRAWLQA
jgi:hypothetical protein